MSSLLSLPWSLILRLLFQVIVFETIFVLFHFFSTFATSLEAAGVSVPQREESWPRFSWPFWVFLHLDRGLMKYDIGFNSNFP